MTSRASPQHNPIAQNNHMVLIRTRLSHGKSKAGCATCKKRRVKCDEGRPGCRKCTISSRTCVYPVIAGLKDWQKNGIHSTFAVLPSAIQTTKPPFFSDTRVSSPDHESMSISSHSSGSSWELIRSSPKVVALPKQTGRLYESEDVQLLCHFISHTSQNLFLQSELIWSRDAVSLAFQHDFLMHAILALSACHLKYLSPQTPSYKLLETHHLERSLQSYRETLRSGVPLSRRDAIIATSFLLAFQACANPVFDPENPLINNLLSLMNGIRTVVASGYGTKSVFDRVLKEPLMLPSKTPVDGPGFDLILMLNTHQPLEIAEETKNLYVRVIESLSTIIDLTRKTYEEGGSPTPDEDLTGYADSLGMVMRWLCFIPPDFVTYINTCEPRALIIMAYYYAAVGTLVNTTAAGKWWWVERPPYMIQSISDYLGPPWATWMLWPRSRIPHMATRQGFKDG